MLLLDGEASIQGPEVVEDSPGKPPQDATPVPIDFGLTPLTPSDTSSLLGVVKVCVKGGEFQSKGHYNVTLSLGMQVRDLLPDGICIIRTFA
jgi:hypothetical protein